MKRIVSLLLLVSAGLFLCVLSFFCAFRHRVEQPDNLEVVQQGQASLEQAELPVAEENAPVAEQAVAAVPEIASVAERSSVAAKPDASLLPVAVSAVETASSSAEAGVSARPDAAAAKPSSENVADNDLAGKKDAVASAELSGATKNAAGEVRPGAIRENRSAVRTEVAAQGKGTPAVEEKTPAAGESIPEDAGGAGSYQYFEYQVITVPKKTLASAAESAGLPKDSKPTDEFAGVLHFHHAYVRAFLNYIRDAVESFGASLRRIDLDLYPVCLFDQPVRFHVAYVVRVVIERCHNGGIVVALKEETFVVKIRKSDRSVETVHAALFAPSSHRVKESFGDLEVIDEIHPTKAYMLESPFLVRTSVDDAGDASDGFVIAVRHPELVVTYFERGVHLGIEAVHLIEEEWRTVIRAIPV